MQFLGKEFCSVYQRGLHAFLRHSWCQGLPATVCVVAVTVSGGFCHRKESNSSRSSGLLLTFSAASRPIGRTLPLAGIAALPVLVLSDFLRQWMEPSRPHFGPGRGFDGSHQLPSLIVLTSAAVVRRRECGINNASLAYAVHRTIGERSSVIQTLLQPGQGTPARPYVLCASAPSSPAPR